MRETLRRELLGIVLTLVALYLAATLALQPLPDEGCWTSGGIAGGIGSCVKWGIVSLIGPAAAWLLPVGAMVHGLRMLGRLSSMTDRSWMVFFLGAAVLLPIGIALASPGDVRDASGSAGVWGSFVAFYLVRLFGSAGAWVVVVLLLSALMAWTLRWNPIRAIVGPSPGPKTGAKTRAETLEPSPEEMPAIVRDEDEREPGDAGTAISKRRARKAAVADSDGQVEVPGTYGREEELPPKELITPAPPRAAEESTRELDDMGEKLMEALRTFRVEGRLVNRTTGPVVTQFEIEPSSGVKVRQFANLANDLALAMRAQSIRVVAPIPGRGAVGVEVPNPIAEVVGFRKLIESDEFTSARASLPIALGEDLEGRPVVADLARMPHLLIAGATGSGKSVCVNTIITSLIYRHTPETLRFLMIDPKMVELSVYNRLPHLRYRVITDNRDAASLLKWAVMEMHDRYHLLAANGARNIQEFNKRVRDGASLVLPKNPDVAFEDRTYREGVKPYIVIVIDELADLMMTVQGEVETPLALLAQKARAIGIHIILATQRPSVNVITGLIKANFPSRIAFRVASQVDSRTIIDGIGAEALLGNGDMLFIPPGKSEPQRIQGAYISGDDTEKLMGWFEDRRAARRATLAMKGVMSDVTDEPDILQVVKDREALEAEPAEDDAVPAGKRDPEFRRAAEVCIQHQLGSTSLLQRRLGIGYGRAARIIDQLHAAGILGPPNGSKPRDILVGLDDLDRIADPEA
ncbi:MAG TPA: DNA translocase FtsK 4TM domain-containing protein [Gemmatimonadaceae bacterium]